MEQAQLHERSLVMTENEKRWKALRKGVEQCDDAEVRLLASRQSELTEKEARQLLGVSADGSAAAAAKKLMAKLYPDRVHLEACKDGLRMRFQIVQHARDVLAPPKGELPIVG